MTPLIDYVLRHTERGDCKCGQCIDKGNKLDPAGYSGKPIRFDLVKRHVMCRLWGLL